MSLTDLFSEVETLVKNGSDSAVTVSSLQGEGKVVGLYFSAHWCPPCRSFTPDLAQWYEKFKKTENGSKFEIVFVSSDRDEKSFEEYFSEMPWLALPFESREKKAQLSKKFKIQGIPTLVFVDGDTGKLITADGRSVVTEDTEGAEFPWVPKKIGEIVAGEVIDNKSGSKQWSDITADVIGLYFSAHWCGPCRAFTPDLIKTYQKIKDGGKSFEIVFVSSDRDESAMKEYFGSMPWLALPYGDSRKKALSRAFDISGIPSLVLMTKDGDIITQNGRSSVSGDADGKDFPWSPKPANMLTSSTASDLNDTASLVWFFDKSKSSLDDVKETLTDIAEDYLKKVKSGENKELFFFFVASEEDEDGDNIGKNLKQFAKIPEAPESLVLTDIPNQQVFNREENTPVNADVIKEVLAQYNSGTLELKTLSK